MKAKVILSALLVVMLFPSLGFSNFRPAASGTTLCGQYVRKTWTSGFTFEFYIFVTSGETLGITSKPPFREEGYYRIYNAEIVQSPTTFADGTHVDRTIKSWSNYDQLNGPQDCIQTTVQGKTCSCVEYMVNKLFKRGLANPWPTQNDKWDEAGKLDSSVYWSADHILATPGITNANGLVRERKPDAQAGDVIIFRSNADFYVKIGSDYKELTQIGLDNGKYVGHVGFVRSATWTTRTLKNLSNKQVTLQGWDIVMESANWLSSWGAHEPAISVGGVTCNNVSYRQIIFVPSGSQVSFWRVKPTVTSQSSGAPAYKHAQVANTVYYAALRKSPGYSNKDETDILANVPAGAIVEILKGPSRADGLNWWNVTWNGYTGWMADHRGNGTVLLVFLP